jgi:hypothetical protein
MLFDGLETERAIGPRAGEEDAHGVLALISSQRAEEVIDRRPVGAGLHGRGHQV